MRACSEFVAQSLYVSIFKRFHCFIVDRVDVLALEIKIYIYIACGVSIGVSKFFDLGLNRILAFKLFAYHLLNCD